MNNYAIDYQVIDDFFTAFSMHHALQLLDKMIFTACSDNVWSGRFPADAVYFSERMTALSDAVFVIADDAALPGVRLQRKQESAVWSLASYETYCGRHKKSTPWHFFPRSLSQKEFCNPYKALGRFTRCCTQTRWNDILKELLHYALSPHNMQEQHEEPGVLRIHRMLHKLIEASHLISVRLAQPQLNESLE